MRKSISEIIKEGKRVKGDLFNIYYRESVNYKIGFIASSKIGKSVKRNYVKRIIRELWKKNFKKGDFIFVLKPPSLNCKREEIEKEIERMVKLVKWENF